MKEQTPITAEEFRNDYAKKLQYLNWDDLCEDLWSKGDAMTKTENEVMEQYANTKVLEALEIVKTLTDNNVEVTSEHIDNLIRSKTKI